jgi:hypothetical protein
MMDWREKICAKCEYKSGPANILIFNREGVILARFIGAAAGTNRNSAFEALDNALSKT